MLKVKDPGSKIAVGFDWSVYLTAVGAGVTIVASTWTFTGPDTALTLSAAGVVTGGARTQVFVEAGTLGATYTLTNRVTTNSSPATIDERSVDILIENQ
jgi:hypothetical protein